MGKVKPKSKPKSKLKRRVKTVATDEVVGRGPVCVDEPDVAEERGEIEIGIPDDNVGRRANDGSPAVAVLDSIRLPVGLLMRMEENPQDQDGATFGQLVESIREIGLAETLLVSGPFPDGKYKIVGGHHKLDAAKVAGLAEVPCMVLPSMSDDEIYVWVVRMNAIRGNLNPWRFTRLFNRLAKKYNPEVLRAKMAITSERLWQQLYKDVRKSLPPEIVKKLDESKKEVQDVEGLARIIKKIFTEHGEQLKCRFMVFEYGGQAHLLLKMQERTAKNIDRLTQEALEAKQDLNWYVNRLLEQRLPDVDCEGEGASA